MSDINNITVRYMTRYHYRESGEVVTFQAISGNETLVKKEMTSVRFQDVSNDKEDWKKYLACLKQIPIFCDQLLNFCKDLDSRGVARNRDGEDAISPERKTKTLDKFRHLEKIFRGLVQPEEPSAEGYQGYDNLNPDLLKKFHLEKEIEKNQIAIEEIGFTLEKCKAGKFTGSGVSKEDDLCSFLEERNEQVVELQRELGELSDKQILGPRPQVLKQRWNKVADDVSKTLDELAEFLRENPAVSLNNVLSTQLNIITRAIMPALNNLLRVPTLEAVSKKKQIVGSNLFVKDCWQVASRLKKLDCELPQDESLGLILEKVYSEVKNLKNYSFEGSEVDIKYDYEFRANSWFYAYVRCLIEQNNRDNEQRVREVYMKYLEGYGKNSDHSSNTSGSKDLNEDRSDLSAPLPEVNYNAEEAAADGTGNDSDFSSPVPDNASGDDSIALSATLPDGGPTTEDESVENTVEKVEKAIVSLDKKYESVRGTLYEISCSLGKQILTAISTPNSVEQNLFLTYLIKYHNRKKKVFISILKNAIGSKAGSPPWVLSFVAVVRSLEISHRMKRDGVVEVFKDKERNLRLFKIKKGSSKEFKIRVFSQKDEKRSFSVPSKEKIDALFSGINNDSRELA